MSIKRTFAIISLLAAVAAAGYFGDMVIAKSKTYPTLESFRLSDVEGNEVSLNDGRLKGKRVAFCFLTTWSGVGENQARRLLAQQDLIGGELVFICGGTERRIREIRKKLGAQANLWLIPDYNVASTFGKAFDDLKSLDRVPALVVVDANRKVVHASAGEISDDEIREALNAQVQ